MKCGTDVIFKALAAIALMVVDFVLMCFCAMVSMILWNWYVPLAFPSAASISLWVVFGLSLLICHLTRTNVTKEELLEHEGSDFWQLFLISAWKSIVSNIVKPATVLLYGWIVHQFV